jgi:hypothetical protein
LGLGLVGWWMGLGLLMVVLRVVWGGGVFVGVGWGRGLLRCGVRLRVCGGMLCFGGFCWWLMWWRWWVRLC